MSQKRRIRVLIVDDSAFSRKVLRRVLSQLPDVEVVGIARDGLDALEQCALLKPEVLTLDLMMPELDGLGVLRALSERPGAPRVVLVSSTALDSALAVEALQLGAFDIVTKPTALATDRLYEMSADLVHKVRLAARAEACDEPSIPEPSPAPIVRRQNRASLLVIGTSTGGPHALTKLLTALPADFPLPIAAVVHIPVGYTSTLAERIDRNSRLRVVEAEEGLEFGRGTAVIARAGLHLRLSRTDLGNARCTLDAEPLNVLHRPSVNVLFESAANAFEAGVMALVMTGMGDDGLLGARTIHDRGGIVLTESSSSCIVDGMPRAIVEAGLSDGQARLEHLAETVLQRL